MNRPGKTSRRVTAGSDILRRAVVTFLIAFPCLALAFPIIDLSGWWVDTEGGMVEIRQQQANLMVYDIWGELMANGFISNDSAFFLVEGDTIVLVYSNNMLSGHNPEGNPIVLTESPGSPDWKEAGCNTMIIDGLTSDWSGVAPVADDADNDATGNSSTEIDKVYLSRDEQYLYVRIDIVGQASPMHSGHNNDRYEVDLQDQGREIDISFWGGHVLRFNDHVRPEIFLEPYRMSDHTVEGRVPLALLNGMQRAELWAGSGFYHSENEFGAYDETQCLAEFGLCSLCGDFDGSGHVLVPDILYLLNWLFTQGPAPSDGSSGDINCDQRTNVGDVVYLVRYIFAGGAVPCSSCR